jgi:hypothetical protein
MFVIFNLFTGYFINGCFRIDKLLTLNKKLQAVFPPILELLPILVHNPIIKQLSTLIVYMVLQWSFPHYKYKDSYDGNLLGFRPN